MQAFFNLVSLQCQDNFDSVKISAYTGVMDTKQPYHHGNLREALLAAALNALEEDGLHKLSLRGVAQRAGVSHAAPAHHFGGLKGMLTALVTLAYTRFAAAMARERLTASPNPAAQLRAAGEGYLAFARQSPALFRLMFSPVDIDWSAPALQQAAAAARRHLTEIAAPAAGVAGLPATA